MAAFEPVVVPPLGDPETQLFIAIEAIFLGFNSLLLVFHFSNGFIFHRQQARSIPLFKFITIALSLAVLDRLSVLIYVIYNANSTTSQNQPVLSSLNSTSTSYNMYLSQLNSDSIPVSVLIKSIHYSSAACVLAVEILISKGFCIVFPGVSSSDMRTAYVMGLCNGIISILFSSFTVVFLQSLLIILTVVNWRFTQSFFQTSVRQKYPHSLTPYPIQTFFFD
jgi:hypothetical protein